MPPALLDPAHVARIELAYAAHLRALHAAFGITPTVVDYDYDRDYVDLPSPPRDLQLRAAWRAVWWSRRMKSCRVAVSVCSAHSATNPANGASRSHATRPSTSALLSSTTDHRGSRSGYQTSPGTTQLIAARAASPKPWATQFTPRLGVRLSRRTTTLDSRLPSPPMRDRHINLHR